MKLSQSFDLGVLRMLSAALKNREIEKRSSGQAPILTDEDTLAILGKEAKKRRDAAQVYESGGRGELKDREIKEAEFIEKYLPKKLSVAEVEEVIKKIVDSGVGDFGMVMRAAMKEFGGRADGKLVGEVVKKLLN
ncbi:MAG: GatB/YqeY domain-containing protein [Candidatus Liptonbacteria bacterium]|nr:GatB/YqeY domain-containing protein [Candidatus Liptonbacteria bacterium]